MNIPKLVSSKNAVPNTCLIGDDKDIESANKARKIYNEELNLDLDKDAFNKFVAIVPDAPKGKNYFLAKTKIEAVKKAKEKYPENKPHVMIVCRKPVLFVETF